MFVFGVLFMTSARGRAIAPDDLDGDPIVRALERSTVAQTLKAARASLVEPSRPFTPLDRSLFQMADNSGGSRPNSGYTVDGLAFVRDTYGRPDIGRSSSLQRPFTIAEEGCSYGAHRRCGSSPDILRLEGEGCDGFPASGRRTSLDDSDAGGGASSGSEELTPVIVSAAAAAPHRGPRTTRPPKPPSGGYPPPAPLAPNSRNNNFPDQSVPRSDPSPRRRRTSGESSPHRRLLTDGSPSRRKSSASPSVRSSPIEPVIVGSGSFSPRTASKRREVDANHKAIISRLQEVAETEDRKTIDDNTLVSVSEQVLSLVVDIQAGEGGQTRQHAPAILRAVLGLLDLKDPKCLFKLCRCALVLLPMDIAVQGVPSAGVHAAYLNVAKVLFKYSKNDCNDSDFLREGLVAPLLGTLASEAPPCASYDLRVYIVGILKNISIDESNQKFLVQSGAIASLFRLMDSDQLTGSLKEGQLLIQVTALLRNLSGSQYKQFLHEERLNALTRVMALFPANVELLTNLSRILAKLTPHGSVVDMFAKSDVHVRQITRTLAANGESPPLVLRLAFVLGNLTAKSDRLRVVFAFDCEGTSLVPDLLQKYWQKERRLAKLELEKGQSTAPGLREIEEVLVKLVRLLANIAISGSAGATLAASSAAVNPLLDMLGAKRIGESEELVLNVVAGITNLLFYDVPSNLLFQEENKKLLCRLFRPLLLESYNTEALVETARALGNLSRHDEETRACIANLRLDEIMVILLDHDNRDLVFYVCGALVNLAADPDCTVRLMGACSVVRKLTQLLNDAPDEDPELQLVAVKVLTNVSLDPSVEWRGKDVEDMRCALLHLGGGGERDVSGDWQQLLELSQRLLERLPECAEDSSATGPEPGVVDGGTAAPISSHSLRFRCNVEGCGRRFDTQDKLVAHEEKRHPIRRPT